MPITFGSVGDVISISLIVKDLVQALGESRGSAAEYQEVIRELWSLDRVLLEVEQLSRNFEHTNELYALWVTAKHVVDECRRSIDHFVEKIKKYDKTLGGHTNRHTIRDVPMKIRWSLVQSGELEKFRAIINAHCSSLGMLLMTASINVMHVSSRKLHEERSTAEESWKNAIQKQNSRLEELQARVDKSTDIIESHTILIRDIMKLDWLRNLATDLKELARKTFFINLATFRTVAEARASLPSHLDCGLIQEPFLLEDAIGRIAPVHLQFICSWDAFFAVLEARFRSLQGYDKIKRKEFVLQERATRRDISHAGPWEGSFLPGQRVDMSITFAEMRRKEQLSCPRCQTANENCSSQSTQCVECGMWYTRVVELCDSDLPSRSDLHPRKVRTTTGAKAKTSISTSEQNTPTHGPFEHAVQGLNSHLQLQAASPSEKHSLEYEFAMREEISHFKRVRIIVRQRRQQNRNSKTDEDPLTQRRASQEGNNSDLCLSDRKAASSETANSLSYSALPRSGYSNNKAGDTMSMDKVSSNYSISSVDGNLGLEGADNYVYENGRRYHAYQEGIYFIPNDEREQERMELQNFVLEVLLDNMLFLAPVENPKMILEFGTDIGIWAIDVANKYENATVIGTDLSPIQLDTPPVNCSFEIDDVNLQWLWDPCSSDFVFSRFANGFSKINWDNYLSESFNSLAPGGWVEIQDMDFVACSDDGSLPQDSSISEWHRLICEGASRGNINMRMSSTALKTKFQKAGFTNITVVDMKLPIGPWSKDRKLKEIGALQLEVFLSGIEAFSQAIFCRFLKWSSSDMQLFLSQVRNDAKKRSVHWYWPFFVVYGQKPVDHP